MKKLLFFKIFFLLFLITNIAFFNGYNAVNILSFDTFLVLDSSGVHDLPHNFRKISDKNYLNEPSINSIALNKLNISGSGQFSDKGLRFIKNSIDPKYNILIIDLREECHGFINGLPVSWKNEKNNANVGLNKEEIIEKENLSLKTIKIGKDLNFTNKNLTILPSIIENESLLVKSNFLSYARIPVTDGKIPTKEMTEYFLNLVNSLPKNYWIHFHCKEGIGRTTTFMIMYDILQNYKEVSLENIIKRQLYISPLSDKSKQSFYSKERIEFLQNFYTQIKNKNL